MISKQYLPLTADLYPHVFDDPKSLPSSLDPFTVTTTTGLLPTHRPKTTLPDIFKPLATLLEDMPVVRADGTSGLLATYKLGDMIDNQSALPDLTSEIDNLRTQDGQRDLASITAAFRDYSFLASAYLLEPCWEHWNSDPDKGYGLGRNTLPACLAGPMVKCADILNIPPFLAYAASYALYNYTISESSSSSPIPPNYKSLSLIRGFERGLDPSSSEAGFILTHVDMVGRTPGLISGAIELLDHLTEHRNNVASSPDDEHQLDPAILTKALNNMLTSMTAIESSMSTMWKNSLPSQYISFRTFIFGITSQSMFPDGVQYQLPPTLLPTLRTFDPETFTAPLFFRGESGANDSIIPLLDYLLTIPFPTNPLTSILHEFRAYRPLPHREFLAYVRDRAAALNVRHVLTTTSFESRYLLLRLLDHVRSFRWRHWTFAREYIIRRTAHPTATGGSPIVLWLPNQLQAVMDLMAGIWEEYDGGHYETRLGMGKEQDERFSEMKTIMHEVYEQRDDLKKEVAKWCQERKA